MTFKDIFIKPARWFGLAKSPTLESSSEKAERQLGSTLEPLSQRSVSQAGPIAARPFSKDQQAQPIEKFQEGFNRLVGQLETISRHLNRQVSFQEDFMKRIEQLPDILETFPECRSSSTYSCPLRKTSS